MLINRNINVDGHRTSMRLEPQFWAALSFIAEREDVSICELCTEIEHGTKSLSRTAAVRAFITAYLMQISMHGDGQPKAQTTHGENKPQDIEEFEGSRFAS